MNLRTTIGSKLLCSLILCFWILCTAQSAKAGPILPGSGYGETADAFRILVMHDAVAADDVHILVPDAPNVGFWNFSIVIREVNGGAGVPDSVQFIVFGQHLVGVPGHTGEGRNEGFRAFNIKISADAPGVNNFVATIDHPPIPGHIDQFGGSVIFTVATDGLNITAFTLEFIGMHCSPQCPSTLPSINKSLRQVPEWNALMLFGSGLTGLLGYVRRRRKCLALENDLRE